MLRMHAELRPTIRDVGSKFADCDELRSPSDTTMLRLRAPLQAELPPVVLPLNRRMF